MKIALCGALRLFIAVVFAMEDSIYARWNVAYDIIRDVIRRKLTGGGKFSGPKTSKNMLYFCQSIWHSL